jgi:hypothetical protein
MHTALPDSIVAILISKEHPREIYTEVPAYSAMESLTLRTIVTDSI